MLSDVTRVAICGGVERGRIEGLEYLHLAQLQEATIPGQLDSHARALNGLAAAEITCTREGRGPVPRATLLSTVLIAHFAVEGRETPSIVVIIQSGDADATNREVAIELHRPPGCWFVCHGFTEEKQRLSVNKK